MKIEKFTKLNNIDKLSKIIFFNFIELQNQPDIEFSINDIRNTLASNNLLGWFLLNNNNNIVGYLIGNIKDMGDGRLVYYISYFYIMPKFQNNGFGTKMLLMCIDYIKKININFIMLISKINTPAYNLYKKLGFVLDPLRKINNNNYKILLFYCN